MGTYLPGLNFPIYSGWTQYTPVIPKLYWDVYSAEQRMKQLCMNFDKVEHYLDYIAALMNQWNIEFTDDLRYELEKMWNAIHEGYENALNEWIRTDGERIFKEIFSNVFFGLTDNGYFCAYVPENWSAIQFDTGMIYGTETYGRLILRYDVDGTGVINNTDAEILPDFYNEIGEYVEQLNINSKDYAK